MEEIQLNEVAAAGPSSLASTPASAAAAELGPVAEDRGRAEEGSAWRQASEAKPDRARNALRSDLQQTRHVPGGRAGSLPCNRVEHRTDE